MITGTPDSISSPPPPTYISKVKGVATANLIDFWTLNDASGTAAVDEITTLRNGTYVAAPTLQFLLFADGVSKAPFFNGTTQYVNIQTASFASTFNNAEGSALIWMNLPNVDWASASVYEFLRIFIDGANAIGIEKNAANSVKFNFNGNIQTVVLTTPSGWFAFVLTWSRSNNRARAYINGVKQGADVALPALAGIPAQSLIMAAEGPSLFCVRNSAMVAIWTTELTQAQVTTVSTAP